MPYTMRELTDAEKEAFLKDNFWGILAFAGDKPYAIPVGYQYIKEDILLGFGPTGRKIEYINKSRNVCLTICRPTALSLSNRSSATLLPSTTTISLLARFTSEMN